MHDMVFGIIRLNRQESARPHMQRYKVPFDAFGIQRIEKPAGEMQPSGRCRNRALFAGIDGLIIGLVARILGAF